MAHSSCYTLAKNLKYSSHPGSRARQGTRISFFHGASLVRTEFPHTADGRRWSKREIISK